MNFYHTNLFQLFIYESTIESTCQLSIFITVSFEISLVKVYQLKENMEYLLIKTEYIHALDVPNIFELRY